MSITPHARRGGAAPLLVIGFAAALAARVAVGGREVAASTTAGLLFAALLLLLAGAAGVRVPLTGRGLAWGVGGAAVLCLPLLLAAGAPRPAELGIWRWALVVTVVAGAEEAFLRGALYDAVAARRGADAAIAAGAVAFALLHLPLYGWGALPLDLAVGVALGELRRLSGTPLAPGLAHVLADWATYLWR